MPADWTVRACAKCRGELQRGLLLCDECLPSGAARQDATVRVGHTRSVTMRLLAGARMPRGRREVQVTATVELNRERGREELRVQVYDYRDRSYSEAWYDETGEITWSKAGALDDPSIHGPTR